MKTKLVAVFDPYSQAPQPRIIMDGHDGEFYMWDVLHGCMTKRSTIVGEYGPVYHAKNLTSEQKAVNSVEMLKLYADFPIKTWESGMEMTGLIDRDGTFYICGGSDHAQTMEQIIWVELQRMPDHEDDIIPAYDRFIHVAVYGSYLQNWVGDDLNPSSGQEQTLLLLLKTFRGSAKTFQQQNFLKHLENDIPQFGIPLPEK